MTGIRNNLATILEGLQHLQGHKNTDFAWRKVTAITMNGVWKNLCLQFVHDFLGFEKVDEEHKEIFSNSVTLSEKLELDLQQDGDRKSVV